MLKKKTLKKKIQYRIKRNAKHAFLRRDFDDLGEYDQVGRALKELNQEGKIIRVGYGIYAKTKTSALSAQQVPARPLTELAKEALRKLKVPMALTKAERAYNQGLSTQVPTGRVIGVKKRISRKIGYKENYIAFEKTT